MSLNVAMAISANTSQARAEIGALGKELQQLEPAAEVGARGASDLDAALAAAVAEIRTMQQALAIAEAKNGEFGASMSAAATRIAALEAAAAKVPAPFRQAAGSVGALTAQFNDIGVMMMAGQNPLQLAIQQGTQITQGFAGMGAAGAVRELGAAFVSMLSPINVVTIGSIALGAALVQWLTDAEEGAQSAEDAISDLGSAVSELSNSINTSLKDLRARFGEVTPAIQAMQQEVTQLRMEEVFLKTADAVSALKAELSGGWITTSAAAMGDLINAPAVEYDMNSQARLSAPVAAFQKNLDGAIAAPDAAERLAAVEQLQAAIRGAADEHGHLNEEQRTFLLNLNQIEQQLRFVLAIEEQKVGAEQEAVRKAEELVANRQYQAQLEALIRQYGDQSLQVATARLAAEREVAVAQIEATNQSEATKAELIAAWDAAAGIASVDMAGNITLAGDAATVLDAKLTSAMAKVEGIRRDQARRRSAGTVFDPRDPRYDPVVAEAARLAAEPNRGRTQSSLSAVGAQSRSGASSARIETDAVAGLVSRKSQELAIMRETDPVQREMIRNRELLSTATDAQRVQVEQVIAALEREKAVQAASDFFASGAADFLTSIVSGSASAEDALDGLIKKLIEAGIQALMLGEGPLAGILGTAGTSIIGTLFGGGGKGTGSLGLPKPLADGGAIHGAGGPREDRVPILASPGEFMVNARATARNRAVLEYINAGGVIGRFADGGAVGGGSAAQGGGAGLSLQFAIDARGGNTAVANEVRAEMMSLMPEIERRAVAAVARARRQGRTA